MNKINDINRYIKQVLEERNYKKLNDITHHVIKELKLFHMYNQIETKQIWGDIPFEEYKNIYKDYNVNELDKIHLSLSTNIE